MADISKIKTLDGTAYNLKDATARNNIPSAATAAPKMDGTAAVGTSAKYAKEDHVHPSDTTKLDKTAELLTTNPFSPYSLQGPYISKIDNVFYAADKRWTITLNGSTQSVLTNLFNGDYESNVLVSSNQSALIKMDFSNESSGCFPGYPYGYILVSFYYSSGPGSVTGRVYCNYEPHGIGWHDLSFQPVSDNTSTAIVYRARQGLYAISLIEITINAPSASNTMITQIEMHLDRPYSGRNPFLSKYAAETLYYPLTAPSFVGPLTGNATSANSATKATQDESGNNIKSSYASSMSISDHTITLKNKNGSSLGTVTVPDNNTTYTANTSKLVTTTVPNVTSVGSAPTLGTAIPADDITAWTTNTPTSFTVSEEKLTIVAGKAATLSYTAKSIPNVTSVGSAPTLGTAITVATGSLASNGGGGTVATGITAS